MKILHRVLVLLVIYAASGLQSSFAEEIYPGETVFLQPSIQTNLVFPLRGNYETGGSVHCELLAGGTFMDMFSLGPSFEYRYYSQSGIASPTAGIGFRGAYAFLLFSGFTVTPVTGFDLIIPFTPDTPVRYEFDLGCRFNFHMYNRSKIFIDGSLAVPLSEAHPILISLGIGVRQSVPEMIPLAEVNPELDLSTRLFSPDGDGQDDILGIAIRMQHPASVKSWNLKIIDRRNNSVFERSGAAAPPELIKWDGFSDDGGFVSSADDLRIECSITDKTGRISRLDEPFVVDVLLIKEGGKMKINIPNIVFPPQSAEISKLTDPVDISKNDQILRRLSEIFNRFADYSIHIEGHANSEFWQTEEGFSAEQKNELLPLSLSRAEKIKESLVALGINAERITVEGFGAKFPVIPFSDTDNNWKNRRVEFILVK